MSDREKAATVGLQSLADVRDLISIRDGLESAGYDLQYELNSGRISVWRDARDD